jgi:hypothetical protein
MAQRGLCTALVGVGGALAGTVLGWWLRDWHGPLGDMGAAEPPALSAPAVHGLELLPRVLAVGLGGPWSEAPRPLPGRPVLVGDLGPLRAWHAGFAELDARVERMPPLGPALAEAFLETPELFLTPYASRFDVPALDLYGPRPTTRKGQDSVATGSSGKTLAASGGWVALCAGLSLTACSAVQVREAEAEWLADCPPEAIEAMDSLGLKFGVPHVVWIQKPVRRQAQPSFLQEGGPQEAIWSTILSYEDPPDELIRLLKKAWVYGHAKRYGKRLSVRFDRLKLADGREFPICAVSYDEWGTEPGLEEWGPGSHAGLGTGSEDPRQLLVLEDLRPGEFPVASSSVRISFGRPLGRLYLRR